MRRNVGLLDRLVRGLVVAPLALLLFLLSSSGSVAGLAAVAVLALAVTTSLTGSCPVYASLGVSTRRRPRAHRLRGTARA